MNDLIITKQGQSLIAKMIAGTDTAKFTKLQASSHDYTSDSLELLSELTEVKQEVEVSSVKKTDTSLVQVIAAIDNTEIVDGYYVRTIGLFAKDSKENEILYAIATDDKPDYMPAFGGKTVSGISYRLNTKVDVANQVIIELNPANSATIEQVEDLEKVVNTHIEKSVVGEEGVHGLRFKDHELQVKKGGEWKSAAQKPYRIMTVKINLNNSNPATCCSYHDDAAEMIPGSKEWDDFFGHYPCLFKNGKEVDKLNRNDFNKFEDGRSADITSGDAGDVMIAFPRRGVKISTSGDIVTVSMTDDPDNSDFKYYAHTKGTQRKEVFYLGAYKGYKDGSNKLRSLKDKAPTVEQTIGTFRTQAQANGSGYEQSAFFQLTFRQVMYLLKYKNLDSQTTIGQGYVAAIKPSYTGGSESYGMDSEIIKKSNPSYMTDQHHHVKLFGLEDFWGNVFEWIDGLVTDLSRNILTATGSYNDSGSGYDNNVNTGSSSNISGWMSKPNGTTELGFTIKEQNGSQTTYFCDPAELCAGRVTYFGGDCFESNGISGAFLLTISKTASHLHERIASRLMYL